MPQKKNPDTLELVRAVAGDAVGDLQGLLTTLKGLPRAYNRDLQRATPHAWDAVDAVTEATEVAAGAVATTTWNEATLADEAGRGFTTATGVADLLAMSGVPFRTAHEVLAVAAGEAEGTPDADALDEATETVLGDSLFDHVDREAVEAALDPVESVASRDSQGGPAPDAVQSQLTAARDALAAAEDAVAARHEALATAEDELDAEVSTYV